MRIGIDIDDTIADTNELLLEYADKYDKIYKDGHGIINKDCYEFNGLYDWTAKDREDFLATYMVEVLEKVKVKDHVKNVIDKLIEDGHEIIFITTRDGDYIEDSHELTKRWLDKNNIKYDLIIAGNKRKSDYAEALKFDLFIDDSIKNCTKVSEKGIEVLLFDTVFNRDNNDFKRVKNWLEIYDYIKSKDNQK